MILFMHGKMCIRDRSQIETKLAKEIIKGTVHQGQHVEVDYQDEFVLKAQ